jgi:hypothetical protein
MPPPYDHHRPLGIVLLYGPRGVRFLICKVPLYSFPPTTPANIIAIGEGEREYAERERERVRY